MGLNKHLIQMLLVQMLILLRIQIQPRIEIIETQVVA